MILSSPETKVITGDPLLENAAELSITMKLSLLGEPISESLCLGLGGRGGGSSSSTGECGGEGGRLDSCLRRTRIISASSAVRVTETDLRPWNFSQPAASLAAVLEGLLGFPSSILFLTDRLRSNAGFFSLSKELSCSSGGFLIRWRLVRLHSLEILFRVENPGGGGKKSCSSLSEGGIVSCGGGGGSGEEDLEEDKEDVE